MKSPGRIVLITIAIALLSLILWYFKSIVAYILIAAVISLIGQPLVSILCKIKIKKIKISRSLGAGITLILFWVLIFTFFRIFIPLIASEAQELSSINVSKIMANIEEPLKKMETFFSATVAVSDKHEFSLTRYIAEKIMSVLNISFVSNFFGFFAGMLGDIFIAIFSISFISFFFLKNEDLFSNAILALIPNQYMEEAQNVFASIGRLLKRYFIGLFVEVLAVAILITIGLSIIGIDFQRVVLIAMFAGIINVIPYIGPLIGAAFGIVIGIATNLHLEFYTELLPLIGLMLIIFISVQLIDNIVFQPLIYSNSVNAHPLEIFLVILLAGNLAGITGMILAIPTYTILRAIAKEFFHGIKVVRKLTEGI